MNTEFIGYQSAQQGSRVDLEDESSTEFEIPRWIDNRDHE